MVNETPAAAAVAAAVSEWRAAIGSEHVTTTAGDLDQASAATYATKSSVLAIVRPGNRNEVQQCLRIANRFLVPLYPVSTGRNWGYGSRSPVLDGATLDLSRLNRVVELNEELAYVTVEPGVTQRQLYELLRARGSKLWMDATGASPDTSVIGNTLERGFGHTPLGEHSIHVCNFEVVLPTGECVETGFGRFESTKAAAVSRWGLGPSLDGLFAQSGLGIVTRMTVWLMPAPEAFCAFFFQTEREVRDVMDALRPLRLSGLLRSVVHVGNDYKVLSSGGQYPWAETNGKTPLSREVVARMRARLKIGRWNGSGGLYGSHGQVREMRRALQRALSGIVTRLMFVDDRKLKLLRTIEKPYAALTRRTDLTRALRVIPSLFELLKGVPTNEFIASTYWRKRMPPPAEPDPDRDRCGLLWASPVAPNTGADVQAVTDLAETIALEHGFEPLISVSMVNERSTISTISLTYDRDVPGEDQRAMACYREVTARLMQLGYPPYRLNTASMEIARSDTPYAEAVRQLKRALDPNGILAPGRYE